MARSLRFALLLTPLMFMTAACRFVEQQKDLAARIAAFCVLRPVLQMQTERAPLTQNSIRDTGAVAQKRTQAVVTEPAKTETQPVHMVTARPVVVHPRAVVHAREHVERAMARCEAQRQLEKARLLAKRRIVIVVPAEGFESVAPIGG